MKESITICPTNRMLYEYPEIDTTIDIMETSYGEVVAIVAIDDRKIDKEEFADKIKKNVKHCISAFKFNDILFVAMFEDVIDDYDKLATEIINEYPFDEDKPRVDDGFDEDLALEISMHERHSFFPYNKVS